MLISIWTGNVGSSAISPWARYENHPPPPLGIFEDSDFWTPWYMTIRYLLVCTQNTGSSNICTPPPLILSGKFNLKGMLYIFFQLQVVIPRIKHEYCYKMLRKTKIKKKTNMGFNNTCNNPLHSKLPASYATCI